MRLRGRLGRCFVELHHGTIFELIRLPTNFDPESCATSQYPIKDPIQSHNVFRSSTDPVSRATKNGQLWGFTVLLKDISKKNELLPRRDASKESVASLGFFKTLLVFNSSPVPWYHDEHGINWGSVFIRALCYRGD